MPGNKEVDSQESNLFEQYDYSSMDDVLDEIGDGGIIAKLQYISKLASMREATHDNNVDVNNRVEDNKDDVVVLYPGRLTSKATASSGTPLESSQGQQHLVPDMIKECIETQGSDIMPPDLATLATCFGIEVEQGLEHHAPSRTI